MTPSCSDITVLITGASRGIGKAIALRLAREGAHIIIAAKSVVENPRLGGTIYSAAEEIERAGGKAYPVPCDIRDENQIIQAIEKGASHFGGIDVLINNASAISLSTIEHTDTSRYDLMQSINSRGTFLMCKHALPWLLKSHNPHVLSLSPPLNMDLKWLSPHPAYTMSKYNMSMITLSLAEAFKGKLAANTLWPRTLIHTAALNIIPGGEKLIAGSRKPEIVAEAAYHILMKTAEQCSGQSLIDEEVLRAEGITNFSSYNTIPGNALIPDLFL